MALSLELKEEITCPIDLELYENPVVLKCLHTLCEKDVKQMMGEDGLLQCPLCNRISQQKDIKKDFKTQRLLDLQIANENRFKDKQKCDACTKDVATSKCKDCNKYFDDLCQKNHLEMKLGKGHTFIKMDEIRRLNKTKIEECIREIENATKSCADVVNQISFDKTDTRKKVSEARSTINATEEILMRTVKETCDQLRMDLKRSENQESQNVSRALENLSAMKGTLEQHQRHMIEIINDQDDKALLDDDHIRGFVEKSRENVHSLENHIQHKKESVGNFRISVSDYNSLLEHIRTLWLHTQYSSDVDVTRKGSGRKYAQQKLLPEVKPDVKDPPHPEVPRQRTKSALAKLIDRKQNAVKYQDFPKTVHRLALIRKDIWALFHDNSIYIFPHRSAMPTDTRTIWIHEPNNNWLYSFFGYKTVYYKVCSVVESTKFGIISACNSVMDQNRNLAHKNIGLAIINQDGAIQRVVTKGKYVDVSTLDDRVYGLADDRVTIHTLEQGRWVTLEIVQLDIGSYDRLSVDADALVLSKNSQGKVTKYDIATKRSTTHGQEGARVEPHLRACLADASGHFLFCDNINGSLWILSPNNEWHSIKLSDPPAKPIDAVFNSEGNLLVLDGKTNTVVKLVPYTPGLQTQVFDMHLPGWQIPKNLA